MMYQNSYEAENKLKASFEAFEIALKAVNLRLKSKETQEISVAPSDSGLDKKMDLTPSQNKYKALRITILFNNSYLHE